ncbi:Uncharacterised protein [uncultured archaeon]|nr:Uncharacterised protein [uncultured archaeon]
MVYNIDKIKNRILDVLIVLIVVGYIFYGIYPKHGDFWVMNYVAKSFAMGNYDFYSYILEIQKLPQNFVAYPPDWYVIQGIYIKILSLLSSYDLHKWSVDFSTAPSFMPLFGILPNIILFFIGGFLIFRIYKRKDLVLGYLASPLAFISIIVMGQMDIYPVFFTLTSLYFAKKAFDADKPFWKIASIISLGIGAQFKIYPLLLLPPLAMLLSNKKMKLSLEFVALGILISLVPWAGYIKWFKFIVLEGESSWLFNLQLSPVNLPQFHTMSIWFIGYCILLWIIYKYSKFNFRNFIGFMFIEISWFFISVYTHPQWWIWLLPISIFVLGEFKNKIFVYLYIILNLLYILYPMMWVNNVDIILREYIPTIPIVGNFAIILVSMIVSILLIWDFELITEILSKERE